MAEIGLRVGGKEYGGWKTARIMRGIESVSGSFELGVSEKWAGQGEPWPILPEAECVLVIGDEKVITGFVDRAEPSYSKDEAGLSVSGRDGTGALVDCSCVLEAWEFKNVSVLAFAKKVCEPFGIAVSLQPGLVLPASPKRISVSPGDLAFAVIERECRKAGVLPVSDGTGGLLLTRAGTARATTKLIEGENILSASASFDATGRFRDYLVMGQHRGANDFFGEAATCEIKGHATDESVTRAGRQLVIRPEGGVTLAQAKTRAQWEATTRAARSCSVSITVQGWTQADGALWPVNVLVAVDSPRIRTKGDLLITEAVYSVGREGTTTQLTLKPRLAFLPEATIKAGASGLWPEIANGV